MVFTAVIRFYAAHHPLTTLIAVKPARTMRDYDTDDDDDADDDDADDAVTVMPKPKFPTKLPGFVHRFQASSTAPEVEVHAATAAAALASSAAAC